MTLVEIRDEGAVHWIGLNRPAGRRMVVKTSRLGPAGCHNHPPGTTVCRAA